jgi:glycine/D-amino acid oxidase-like deaminating enzyme
MSRLVVVGAGIVGAAIGYYAARRGAAVTLVDEVPPGLGVTGRSFAWIGASGQWPGGAMELRGGVLPQWRRLEEDLPEVHVRWTGSLSWQAYPSSPIDVSVGDGVDEEVLTAAQVAAIEPNLREPPAWAVRCGSDGAVDPLAVTEALVQAARDHGAHVLLGATVTSLRIEGARVVGVETSAGFLPADTVIAAAGTGVPRLCAAFDAPIPVTASPAVLLRFHAPQGLVKTLIASPEVEVRQGHDGQLLAAAGCDVDTSEEALDHIARRTAQAIIATFRGAEDIQLHTAQVGQRPMPADRAPIIGPVPNAEGLYVAVMHSGVTLAPLVGHLVAREVVDGAESHELVGCRPARFAVS